MLFLSEEPGAGGQRVTPAAWRATGAFACVAIGQLAALELWRAGAVLSSAVWFGAGLLALALAVALPRGPQTAGLAVCAALLAGGHMTARVLEPSPDSLAAALPAPAEPGGGLIVTLDGAVTEPVERVERAGALAGYLPMGESHAFTLGVERLVGEAHDRPASGSVRVFVGGGGLALAPGDRARVTGIFSPIIGPTNPGQSDPRLWAAQEGRAGRLSVASPALIEQLAPSTGLAAGVERGWLRARWWLRTRALAVLGERESDGRAMLGALLLGERDVRGEDLRGAFARQGLAHVLAISGFHLAVMAGAALFAVRLTGDRGRLEPLLVALLVLTYVLVLPARAPILRAAVMVLAWLAAESAGRRYDRRALLAWVAIAVLLVRPMELFSLGYQLTFGITAALVWFGSSVHGRLFPGAVTFERHEPPDALTWRWWRARSTGLVSASILCWLVATPLAARTVGIVSPWAVLATVVVVPAVTVLLWAGFAAMVVGVLVPPAGAAASAVLDGVAGAIVAIVRFFDSLPLTTLYVPQLSVGLTAALTGLLLWSLARGRVRSPGLWAATILAAGWVAGELRLASRVDQGVVLRIDMLDVGDGSCYLLRSGSEAVLWDCGSLRTGLGVRTIPRAVRGLGAWRVPEVIVTHANFDHYSALVDAAGPLGVERVSLPRAFLDRAQREPSGAAAAMLDAMARAGIEVRALAAGDALPFGEVMAGVLSPPDPTGFSTDNDNSLVVRIEVPTANGARRALLCGDIQREAIARLMHPEADLRADVMELPHHGSVQPTALALVDAVDPAVVLQSTGPSRALDIRWNQQRTGRQWWTTATDGASWVEIRADGEIKSGSVRRE